MGLCGHSSVQLSQKAIHNPSFPAMASGLAMNRTGRSAIDLITGDDRVTYHTEHSQHSFLAGFNHFPNFLSTSEREESPKRWVYPGQYCMLMSQTQHAYHGHLLVALKYYHQDPYYTTTILLHWWIDAEWKQPQSTLTSLCTTSLMGISLVR